MEMTHMQRDCRAAFTLVELLVVIGLMAVLATISVAGYSAASRGMADRGVIQTTVSALRIARQTCQIDRVPTKVLFFNQRLSDDADDDDPSLFQGSAIAIRQAGRITLPPGDTGLLIDEFADWHQSYPTSGSAQAPGMRIFRMRPDDKQSDIKGCSLLVQPFVSRYELDDYMIQARKTMKDWCSDHKKNDNKYVWGFKPAQKSDGGASLESWKKGDPYGVEIVRFDLPKGYIFGNKEPGKGERGLVAASISEVSFNPKNFEPHMDPGTVKVSLMRPQGRDFKPETVADINDQMLTDVNN